MKDIQIIDLIIADVQKFMINNRINPVNVELFQSNGVPISCTGDITEDQKEKINEHLKKYKSKYEIIKLIINHRYGTISEMEKQIGKTQIGKRFKTFIRNEKELMDMLGCDQRLKLTNNNIYLKGTKIF